MTSEPVRITATISTLVQSVIALLQVFGITQWTGEQVGTVMGVVAAVTGFFLATFVRSQVTPNAALPPTPKG